MGFSLQKAQSLTQLSLAANVSYLSKKWYIKADASSFFSNQEDVESTKRNLLAFDFMRIFKKGWTGTAFTQLEQSTELNLALRLLAGSGVGRYFVRTNRQTLTGIAAVDVTREDYIDETESKTSMEAVFGVSYQAFRYVFPNMDISASVFAYPNLTTQGRVRLNFQTTVRYEVFRRFYVALGFIDSYDSKPGGETTAKNDYSLTFSISWSLT